MSSDNLLQLQNGNKGFGTRNLFSEASFSVNQGEHVGVIGPNGAGKTTLFKIITGEEGLDSGQMIRSRSLKLGYLPQHDPLELHPTLTVEEYLTHGQESGLPLWELKQLGTGLGVSEARFAAKFSSLSGGYRMRIKLLKLLGSEPNLMLLDEPTNYLDLETLLVLERFLQSYSGGFLLISHDREFLRRTTDHILEVEGGEVTKYNGNIDDYFDQKALLRTQLEAQALSQADKRKQILDFVARFGAKATKASQAQARLKQLHKMEQIEIKPLPTRARIRIPAPHRKHRLVLSVHQASLGYPTFKVLDRLEMSLAGGDHLAVVGLNGAGKSTLLKTLAGRLPLLSGQMEWGYEVTTAFYAQHVAEELNADDTVFRALERKAHPSVLPQDILDLAGSLLFSGDAVQKPIRVLSGGERSRVALGQCLLQKASCLLLDEPTNHLDFDTVEALTQALSQYEGCVILVSHDRGFIRRVGTKILEVRKGSASVYPGTYEEYVWSLEKNPPAPEEDSQGRGSSSAAPPTEGRAPDTRDPGYREKKKQLDRRKIQLADQLEKLTKKTEKLSAALAELNNDLLHATDPAKRLHAVREMGKTQEQLSDAEMQWLAAAEEKETVDKELADLTGVRAGT